MKPHPAFSPFPLSDQDAVLYARLWCQVMVIGGEKLEKISHFIQRAFKHRLGGTSPGEGSERMRTRQEKPAANSACPTATPNTHTHTHTHYTKVGKIPGISKRGLVYRRVRYQRYIAVFGPWARGPGLGSSQT
jgi:hypothetical protein